MRNRDNDDELEAAKQTILVGLLWATAGFALSYASYNAAAEGGSYVFFTGAVVYGIIKVIDGLAGYVSVRKRRSR